MSNSELFNNVKSGEFTCAGGANVVVTPGCDLSANSVILINGQPITGLTQANPPSLVSVDLALNTFTIVCGGANVATYRYVVLNAK